MSEKKGIDVGGGITLDDDEFATTPGLDFTVSKKGTSIGARIEKPISKVDKRNINSAIGFDITKENEDSSFGLSGTKQGKSKRLELRFSKNSLFSLSLTNSVFTAIIFFDSLVFFDKLVAFCLIYNSLIITIYLLIIF